MTDRPTIARAVEQGLSMARRELALLLAVLAVVFGVWAFVEIAENVGAGDARAFDVSVLRLMRRADDPARPVGPAWLPEAARDVTALGSTIVLVLTLLAVLGYLALERKLREIVLLTLTAGGGLLLSPAEGRLRPAASGRRPPPGAGR